MKKRGSVNTTIIVMIIIACSILWSGVAFAAAPAAVWVAPSEENGIPSQIDLFEAEGIDALGEQDPSFQLFLPGNADPEKCFLSWEGEATVSVDGNTYVSGACPIPVPGEQKNYSFMDGEQNSESIRVETYQGSASVQPIFIEIDETKGTIAAMDGDLKHETTCSGRICISGQWHTMKKIKGRGNLSWHQAVDKHPYNITLDSKITIPGIDSAPTKKWTILSELVDHSLLRNRVGFHLAHALDVGQDTVSSDVWMNGEYQGCYTVTPKNDSFVPKSGYQIELDNYKESATVAEGGDPQFELEGMNESRKYQNWITVKELGDNLLKKDGEVDDSPENIEAVTAGIQDWMQDAWDAIRSDDGYNSKGRYYTEYIDIESFARMYLIQEYVKSYDVCAGSLFFHRDGTSDNDKLFAGPLWDLDSALGCAQIRLQFGELQTGKGAFLTQIDESRRTCLFKTLGRHDDFMDEVINQYTAHQQAFDALGDAVAQMTFEIGASAAMNHIKAVDIQKGNFFKYNTTTILEKGTEYEQTMLATTNSKSDWPNYAANLKTYITARSLWFRNTNFRCPHERTSDIVTRATPDADGCIRGECAVCGKLMKEAVIYAPQTFELNAKTYTYNGSAHVPQVTVKDSEGVVITDTDYAVTIENSKGASVTSPKKAGAYTVTITFHGRWYTGSKSLTFRINKAAQRIKSITPTSRSYKAVKKTGKLGKTCTFTLKVSAVPKSGGGKVSFRKINKTGKSMIKVAKNGKVTVQKGLKKGTYKVKVKATKATNTNYKKAAKTVTVKIVIK